LNNFLKWYILPKATETEKNMAKAKILLVEDSKSQAKVTREFLERNGYEVDWVEDGTSAIKKAKTQSVDVILLDFMLPDINGNEVCRWLRLNHDTRGIPIIMVTAQSATDTKVACLQAGADDCLPKPYNEIELNARIYACLRTKGLQDELRQKNRQLEEMLEKVEILAITDPLTELFNRRRCESVLESEFSRAQRYQSPFSCLMMDIDHFKKINDVYGHRTGDTVLKETAQIIKHTIREVDTPARWGGEEFIVLLPQILKENALHVASRLLGAFSTHSFSGLPDQQVTISIGIAGMPDPSIDSGEKLIHAADIALYEAKRKGRNRIEIA
jgi:two-component system cell cycle response regulator